MLVYKYDSNKGDNERKSVGRYRHRLNQQRSAHVLSKAKLVMQMIIEEVESCLKLHEQPKAIHGTQRFIPERRYCDYLKISR